MEQSAGAWSPRLRRKGQREINYNELIEAESEPFCKINWFSIWPGAKIRNESADLEITGRRRQSYVVLVRMMMGERRLNEWMMVTTTSIVTMKITTTGT